MYRVLSFFYIHLQSTAVAAKNSREQSVGQLEKRDLLV